jgi:hypothetical protein
MDVHPHESVSPTESRAARALLAVLAIVAAAALSTRAWTQEPVDASASSIGGSWDLAIPEADARERINRAIAQAVDGLPPIIDEIAAGQLRGRILLSSSINIALTASRIAVRFDNALYDSTPGTSSECPMAGNPDETVQFVQHLRGGHLEQIFSTPNGRRWNTFVVSGDGSALTLRVVVQSDRLPAALRFELPYRRVASN